jgi:hypothetical protein
MSSPDARPEIAVTSSHQPAGRGGRRFPLGTTTLPSDELRPDPRGNRGADVELDAGGISWVWREQHQARAYADIRGIALEWESGGSDVGVPGNEVALCTILFSDGLRLIVSSGPGLFRGSAESAESRAPREYRPIASSSPNCTNASTHRTGRELPSSLADNPIGWAFGSRFMPCGLEAPS